MTGKISEDSAASSLHRADVFPIVRSGVNYANPISDIGPMRVMDARMFDVAKGNSAATNATNLQAGIDYLYGLGGGIITVGEPYPCNPITLKPNVHLRGNQVWMGKGRAPEGGSGTTPGGGAFLITSTGAPFITVQQFSSVHGLTFCYPSQNYLVYASRTTYPATISGDFSVGSLCDSISVCNNVFIGSTSCIEFLGSSGSGHIVGDLEIIGNYAYPIAGSFLTMTYVLDIPRVHRNHINPGLQPKQAVTSNGLCFDNDVIIGNLTSGGQCFYASEVDQGSWVDNFAFGMRGGFFFNDCYGSVIGCSADTCISGLWNIGSASNLRVLQVTNFGCAMSDWPSGPAAQFAVYFQGAASIMQITQLHSFHGGAAAVEVAGSGAQKLFISN